MKTETATLLGTGVLSWGRHERVSDRYGSCFLMQEGSNSFGATPAPLNRSIPETTRGRLVAVVKVARESTHIGDMFRGIFPEMPEVGERIVLGEGLLFYHEEDGYQIVGLVPEDERASDWMDPRALYRAHEQSVELWFEPATA